jgi:hypothetical protein
MRAGWLAVSASVFLCGAIVTAATDAGAQRRDRDRSRRDYQDGQRYGFNIRTPRGGDQVVTSCNDLEVTVRNGEMAMDQEIQNVPASAQALSVSGATNGPVYVSGSDRADYQLTLCKYTAADNGDQARLLLGNVSLKVANGRASVESPGDDRYLAYLIVEAPRNARLNVDVTNGPLALRSLSGNIVARTLNGPLAVHGVSGEVDVQATNGPVSLADAAGHVRVNAQNGPLSVNLSGTDWQGSGLEALAQNGPLSLAVPENYRSGVQVDISPNSPFSCASAACRNAQRNWDDRSRTLHLGSDPNPIVHVSAVNGPVSIGSGRED